LTLDRQNDQLKQENTKLKLARDKQRPHPNYLAGIEDRGLTICVNKA